MQIERENTKAKSKMTKAEKSQMKKQKAKDFNAAAVSSAKKKR